MNKIHRFITNSRYSGSYNDKLKCMDGFGSYFFPDGSDYRGYFKNGKFHGYGRIRTALPGRFIILGQFKNGSLVMIEEMRFPDGLRFTGDLDGDQLDSELWMYCNEFDRRYSTEIDLGMEPVGPGSYLTRDKRTRRVPPGAYDVEEGIFKPRTGLITGRPPPFDPYRFVGCHEEWTALTKHCRKGRTRTTSPAGAPNKQTIQKIIDTNIEALQKLGENLPTCWCNELPYRGFGPIEADGMNGAQTPTDSMPLLRSSESRSSLSAPTPRLQSLQQQVDLELQTLRIPKHCKQLYNDDRYLMERATVCFNDRFSKFFECT